MLKIPQEQFQGYIFDCDGTLADTMPLHYKAWKQAFAQHGAKFDFTWELFYSLAGTGLVDSVNILNKRYADNLPAEEVVETQMQLIDEEHPAIQPISEVVALARQYSKTHATSVASGGTRTHVHRTLQYIGLESIFPVIVTQEDVENSKPAPDLFLLAAKKMGVAPETCLVFEDSKLGIAAAGAAGMASVYVEPKPFNE